MNEGRLEISGAISEPKPKKTSNNSPINKTHLPTVASCTKHINRLRCAWDWDEDQRRSRVTLAFTLPKLINLTRNSPQLASNPRSTINLGEFVTPPRILAITDSINCVECYWERLGRLWAALRGVQLCWIKLVLCWCLGNLGMLFLAEIDFNAREASGLRRVCAVLVTRRLRIYWFVLLQWLCLSAIIVGRRILRCGVYCIMIIVHFISVSISLRIEICMDINLLEDCYIRTRLGFPLSCQSPGTSNLELRYFEKEESNGE